MDGILPFMCTEFYRKRFDVEFKPSSFWNVIVDQDNAGPNFIANKFFRTKLYLGRVYSGPNFVYKMFYLE